MVLHVLSMDVILEIRMKSDVFHRIQVFLYPWRSVNNLYKISHQIYLNCRLWCSRPEFYYVEEWKCMTNSEIGDLMLITCHMRLLIVFWKQPFCRICSMLFWGHCNSIFPLYRNYLSLVTELGMWTQDSERKRLHVVSGKLSIQFLMLRQTISRLK